MIITFAILNSLVYVNGGIMLALLAACFAVRGLTFEGKVMSESGFLLN